MPKRCKKRGDLQVDERRSAKSPPASTASTSLSNFPSQTGAFRPMNAEATERLLDQFESVVNNATAIASESEVNVEKLKALERGQEHGAARGRRVSLKCFGRVLVGFNEVMRLLENQLPTAPRRLMVVCILKDTDGAATAASPALALMRRGLWAACAKRRVPCVTLGGGAATRLRMKNILHLRTSTCFGITCSEPDAPREGARAARGDAPINETLLHAQVDAFGEQVIHMGSQFS